MIYYPVTSPRSDTLFAYPGSGPEPASVILPADTPSESGQPSAAALWETSGYDTGTPATTVATTPAIAAGAQMVAGAGT